MKEYLGSILTVLLVSCLASVLMPDGESKKGVRVALSLVVLLSVIAPLRDGSIAELFPSDTGAILPDTELSGEAWIEAQEKAAIEEGIAVYLCDRYRLPSGSVRAEVTCRIDRGEGREVSVSAMVLHLYGRAGLSNVPAMVEDVRAEIGVECEVVYHRA